MIDPGYPETERRIIIDEPEYTGSYHVADLGEGRKMTFVHFDVFYFSASILKQLDHQWRLFRECFPVVVYCMGDVCDPKFAKFVSRFGFEYLTDVVCSDGATRRLYVNYGPARQEAQEQ